MADAADHAWTIAVATGRIPLLPHSPPLHHSGGGLNVAARHILLALHLYHRDLHLPDPQLPAPQAAALTAEAWADTAPEEIAAYLRITCRRFNTALGRRKGTPYPLSALLYTAHHPHPAQQKPPEGWASFRDAHLAAPDEATATRMGLTDQETYVRGLKTSLQEADRWHARSLFAPTGTGGFTRPRHPPGQEDQDRSGGSPARPAAGRHAPTRARVQPHRTTPRPDPRDTPTKPPPPAPTTTTVLQHPNPAAQSATTAHTRPHHARTTIRAEPGDMAPPTPPPRPRPSQPLPPNAPMLQRPPQATSPPRPSTTRPQEPPTPHGTHHRTTPSRIPPPPSPTTTPTNAGVPHTTSTPSTPPPRGPAPTATPATRAHNTRATVHPHGPAGSRARTPATPRPSRSAPPPPAAPPPTSHTSEHHPPAATHYMRTTAPPGRPCGRLPPTPRHHNQSRTARTARRTHATPTRPTGTPRPPPRTTPTPAPPHHQQRRPHTPPRPPPETKPRTQQAAASTSQLTSMPLPTHATANPPSRDRHKRPHHRTPCTTTTTTPPNPDHPPHHRPNPTPYTTPQRYGSTSGDSGNRTCCASAPPAPAPASGRPPWSRRPPWGKASETSSPT